MTNLMRQFLFLISLMLAPILAPGAQGQMTFGGTIGDIEVEGNQRFSAQAVIQQSGLKIGDPFDAFVLNDAIKALYKTENYQTVAFDRRGSTLIIQVEETNFISKILFVGNEAFESEELAGFITLQPTDPLSRAQLQQDVNIILSAYSQKGFYNAAVDPRLIDQGQGRVEVQFNITEGIKSRVSSVNFVGNRGFSDRHLRGVIATKQFTRIRGVLGGDEFSEAKLSQDRSTLERFYKENGYADFRLISAQGALASDRSGFVVTFVLDEGPLYRIGEIKIVSNIDGLEPADLKPALRMRAGRTYVASTADHNAALIRDQAEALGFATAVVTPELETKPDDGLLDLIFKVEEGPRVTVERIEVRGNLRTRDEVVRREMRLAEGDGYSETGLRRSIQRVRGLGYFGDVAVRTEPGSADDQVVVIVEVAEASTGSLNFGGGISSDSSATLNLSYEERNFLGRGQFLSVGAILGQDNTNFDITFREPWFLDREISAGWRVFYSTINQANSNYDSLEYGATIDMGYKLSERLAQNWSYTLKQSDISNVTSTEPALLDQSGKSTRSIVGSRFSFNDLDSTLDPSDGVLWSLSSQMAGLGGDVRWLSNEFRVSQYRSLNETFVLNLRGQAGFVFSLDNDPVPLVDRFVEGKDLVRGFTSNGLGPKTETGGSTIGATKYAGVSADLIFPFPGLADFGFKGRFFLDAGTAFDEGSNYTIDYGSGDTNILDSTSLRSSIGYGFTWASPLGPLKLDWTYPLSEEGFDTTQRVQFSFGASL